MKPVLCFFLLPLLFVMTTSCEDDPLLAPSAPEEDKGSYAKLSLPGSGHRSHQRDNPEIY